MSIDQNYQEHEEEMLEDMNYVHDLMSKSETGRNVLEASDAMIESGKMEELLFEISAADFPEVTDEEKIALMQHSGDILKRDPENGMKLFANYLTMIASDPTYATRADYYLRISSSAIELSETKEYQDFVIANKLFESDNSAEAIEAQNASKLAQEKIKQWAIV